MWWTCRCRGVSRFFLAWLARLLACLRDFLVWFWKKRSAARGRAVRRGSVVLLLLFLLLLLLLFVLGVFSFSFQSSFRFQLLSLGGCRWIGRSVLVLLIICPQAPPPSPSPSRIYLSRMLLSSHIYSRCMYIRIHTYLTRAWHTHTASHDSAVRRR